MSTREGRTADADDSQAEQAQEDPMGPPAPKPAHRWTPEQASTAGRKGGSSPKRPKGLGKKRRSRDGQA